MRFKFGEGWSDLSRSQTAAISYTIDHGPLKSGSMRLFTGITTIVDQHSQPRSFGIVMAKHDATDPISLVRKEFSRLANPEWSVALQKHQSSLGISALSS
jgi:hypothetical protein